METLFYIGKAGELSTGIFGTLFECAKWAFSHESINEEPDSSDPLEDLHLRVPDFEQKYQLLPAETALPRLLTLEEATLLDAAPYENIHAVQSWLADENFDRATLRQMADILHARVSGVRWRGVVHAVGCSPLTNDQYDLIQRQLG